MKTRDGELYNRAVCTRNPAHPFARSCTGQNDEIVRGMKRRFPHSTSPILDALTLIALNEKRAFRRINHPWNLHVPRQVSAIRGNIDTSPLTLTISFTISHLLRSYWNLAGERQCEVKRRRALEALTLTDSPVGETSPDFFRLQIPANRQHFTPKYETEAGRQTPETGCDIARIYPKTSQSFQSQTFQTHLHRHFSLWFAS